MRRRPKFDEPLTVIYLIGGPPRGGKTTLSEALAKRLSVPYFALDHVTTLISPYIPEREYAARLPLRVASQETGPGADAFYAKHSAEQIVDFYLRQAETFWPGVENFIKYAVEDEHDLILEGWQILPRLLRAAVTPENEKRLRIIFLYKTDVQRIVHGLKSNTARKDWVIRNTRDEGTFTAIAKMISHFGSYIEREAKEFNFRCLNVDSDFARKVKELSESMSDGGH